MIGFRERVFDKGDTEQSEALYWLGKTERLLREYHQRNTALANLSSELRAEEKALANGDDLPSTVSQWAADRVSGGHSKSIEDILQKRNQRRQKIYALKQKINKLRSEQNKITKAIKALSVEDKKIISDRFWEGKNYFIMGRERNMDADAMTARAKDVIRKVAYMVFGYKALNPDEL